MPMLPFDLQGHRGARGLKPENTLPSFEVAFDLEVTSVETDLHLTRDGVPVLCHDPVLAPPVCQLRPGWDAPALPVRVCAITAAELRAYRVAGNPHPGRFPLQEARPTPLASWFAAEHRMDPFGVPTLDDLYAFVAAYAGAPGAAAGKSERQRRHACTVVLDLEIKRVPFHPEWTDVAAADGSVVLLENRLVEVVRAWNAVGRTRVRSFDHRSVRAVRRREPGINTAVLVAGTAPVDPAALAVQAGATIYCPEYTYLDQEQVQALHGAGIQVVPWTVNEEETGRHLLAWGVDGITTDYPDRLAAWVRN